jgi:hypothetical protein
MKPMEGRRQPGRVEVKAQAQIVLILVEPSPKLILMNREFYLCQGYGYVITKNTD